MDQSANPYAAPLASITEPQTLERKNPVPVGKGLRFVNYLVDSVMIGLMGFVFGLVAVILYGAQAAESIDRIPGIFFGIPFTLTYYILTEGATSLTLGKLITGTIVVNHRGERPTFGQIIKRTLSRLIPFEAFSFLGTPTVGWHDSISETLVVKRP